MCVSCCVRCCAVAATCLLPVTDLACTTISPPSTLSSDASYPSQDDGAAKAGPGSAGSDGRSTLAGTQTAGSGSAEPLPNTGTPQMTGVGLADQPCAPDGARACPGYATLEKLVCTGGRWTIAGYCDGNDRCDTKDGSTQGSCQPIAAACLGAQSNEHVCDATTRKRCDRDLVRAADDACPEHAHCEQTDAVRCVCDSGYRDQSGLCVRAVTCPAGACTPGGRCLANASGYTCMCDDGFQGSGTSACVSASDACAEALSCEQEYESVGKAGDYTCRGQFADWPMPDTLPDSKVAAKYTVSVDGQTIVDEVTKLIWQATVPGLIPGCTGRIDQDVGLNRCATVGEATSYCFRLSIGGFSDWRVPTKIEMESLLDSRNTQSASLALRIPAVFGTNTTDQYFTSSPYRGPEGGVWVVQGWRSIRNGGTEGRVRCVRGP